MWASVFSGRFRRESGWAVEPVYLPGAFDSPVLRVRVTSAAARDSWRVAGEFVQVFEQVAGFDFEGESNLAPLNALKLLRFSADFESPYALKFYPKRWVEEYEIEIEKFIN